MTYSKTDLPGAQAPSTVGAERCRSMADEVHRELNAYVASPAGWDAEDIDRITGTLLPNVYDCLNLLAQAASEPVADEKRRGRNAKMDTFLGKVNGSTLASFPIHTAMNVGPAMADIEHPPYDRNDSTQNASL